jgi:hypothetical protein
MPTQKAQLEFILQSLKEAIERMRPDLIAANEGPEPFQAGADAVEQHQRGRGTPSTADANAQQLAGDLNHLDFTEHGGACRLSVGGKIACRAALRVQVLSHPVLPSSPQNL